MFVNKKKRKITPKNIARCRNLSTFAAVGRIYGQGCFPYPETFMAKELSILMPTYNNVCVQLVERLWRQASLVPGLRYEILVADDGSTDRRAVEENRAVNSFVNCRYIERETNAGRAAIRNFLAREARYSRLLFLDSDMKVSSPSFVENYVNTEGSAVVGGLKVGGDPERWAGNLRYRYEKAYECGHGCGHRNANQHREFRTVNFLVSKETAEECPFDENFKCYGYEDVLFGKALSARGTAVVHIDNPVVIDDFEGNAHYLAKTEEACRTLYRFRDELRGYSKIIRCRDILKRIPGACRLLDKAYSLLGGVLRSNLTGRHPSVFLFNVYKLMCYIRLDISCGNGACNGRQTKKTHRKIW